MDNQIWHGWFSQKAVSVGCGIAKYRSTNGDVVEITEVTRENKPFGKWDDYVYVGEVCECVQTKVLKPQPTTNAERKEKLAEVLDKLREDNYLLKAPKPFLRFGGSKIVPASAYSEQYRWN